jgi:hypothetical protein
MFRYLLGQQNFYFAGQESSGCGIVAAQRLRSAPGASSKKTCWKYSGVIEDD